MRIGFFVGIPWLDASAAISQNAPTLDLVFDQNVYYVYEYSPLDPSLNLDFVNQSYGSE
jgi:hypothetical protein